MATVNVTVLSETTVWDAGCVVSVGGVLTVSVAPELVAVLVVLVRSAE